MLWTWGVQGARCEALEQGDAPRLVSGGDAGDGVAQVTPRMRNDCTKQPHRYGNNRSNSRLG